MQSLHGLDDERIAAALISHLHVALVFAGSGDHERALGGVVAPGFLHVNMLTGLAAEDGGRGVPEVWRGDGDGVEVRIIKHAPQVGDAAARGGLALGDDRQAVGSAVIVDVANVSHLDV